VYKNERFGQKLRAPPFTYSHSAPCKQLDRPPFPASVQNEVKISLRFPEIPLIFSKIPLIFLQIPLIFLQISMIF
jgi:hypothetical protein